MKRLNNFRQTLSTKEMSSVFGGASSWVCISDSPHGPCGDTETVVTDDNGTVQYAVVTLNECPQPVYT